MMELQPGEFGEIEPASETMKRLMEMFDKGETPYAVHFGTEQDLKLKKLEIGEPSAKKSDIEALQAQIDEMKDSLQVEPRVARGLTIPTRDEIEKFGVK